MRVPGSLGADPPFDPRTVRVLVDRLKQAFARSAWSKPVLEDAPRSLCKNFGALEGQSQELVLRLVEGCGAGPAKSLIHNPRQCNYCGALRRFTA